MFILRSELEILPQPRRSRRETESPLLSNSVTPSMVKQSPQTPGKHNSWITSSKQAVSDGFSQGRSLQVEAFSTPRAFFPLSNCQRNTTIIPFISLHHIPTEE